MDEGPKVPLLHPWSRTPPCPNTLPTIIATRHDRCATPTCLYFTTNAWLIIQSIDHECQWLLKRLMPKLSERKNKLKRKSGHSCEFLLSIFDWFSCAFKGDKTKMMISLWIACFVHGFLQGLPPLTFPDWRDRYPLAFAFVVIIVVAEALGAIEARQFIAGLRVYIFQEWLW